MPGIVKKSCFYSVAPLCVIMQPYYSGICPPCSSQKNWSMLLSRNCKLWHYDRNCDCTFCSDCDHSSSCSSSLCPECSGDPCPLEHTDDRISWIIPASHKQVSTTLDVQAPSQMVHVTTTGTRSDFMQGWKKAHESVRDHILHVKWHKEKIKHLKKNLPTNTIMMRWDFLMNYTHTSRIEMGNAFYGRCQTSLLVATVWHHKEDQIVKHYHAFVSPFLSHTSVFSTKAFASLLPILNLPDMKRML